jgi:hypothetical protein
MKFQLRAPKEAFRCMERCWALKPTLKCVVERIEDWKYNIDKLIEDEGAIVRGLARPETPTSLG